MLSGLGLQLLYKDQLTIRDDKDAQWDWNIQAAAGMQVPCEALLHVFPYPTKCSDSHKFPCIKQYLKDLKIVNIAIPKALFTRVGVTQAPKHVNCPSRRI